MTKKDYEQCSPEPEAMITSLRAFGYNLSMAIADLIDNSIYAEAKNIQVDYDWNSGRPWVRIVDDGSGMNEDYLRTAMRLGSQSPLKNREPKDLGRFGLGLKTASFSQCRVMTVKTKQASGNVSLRCWDLDHVVDTNRWEISTSPPRGAQQFLKLIDSYDHGTLVLWQKLDRVIQEEKEHEDSDSENAEDHFLSRFQAVTQYLEMVFHRYLAGKQAVNIKIGRHDS